MLEHGMGLMNFREDNSCENIFTSLIEILRKELVVYQELKSTIVDEKVILKKPSLDEINHNNARQENIILKARMLVEARTNILKKIARNFDINANSIILSQLIGYADNEQRIEIEEVRDALTLISQEISDLNRTNQNLLHVSMNNIKSSLDFINSIASSGSVYLQCGKVKSLNKNGICLHREG